MHGPPVVGGTSRPPCLLFASALTWEILLTSGCWITRAPRVSATVMGSGEQERQERWSYFWNDLPRARVTFYILSVSISRNAKTSTAKSFRQTNSCLSPARLTSGSFAA